MAFQTRLLAPLVVCSRWNPTVNHLRTCEKTADWDEWCSVKERRKILDQLLKISRGNGNTRKKVLLQQHKRQCFGRKRDEWFRGRQLARLSLTQTKDFGCVWTPLEQCQTFKGPWWMDSVRFVNWLICLIVHLSNSQKCSGFVIVICFMRKGRRTRAIILKKDVPIIWELKFFYKDQYYFGQETQSTITPFALRSFFACVISWR